jgi:antibiotic biosynthesis monooxygenase (ABM) superfamily enzyme
MDSSQQRSSTRIVAPGSPIALKSAQASSVIIHHVPADKEAVFWEWQQGIVGAASNFVGYRGTDIYPPENVEGDEWVIILHFDQQANFQNWLASEERRQWLDRFPLPNRDYHFEVLPSGFAPWFAGLVQRSRALPPAAWMMAFTVLLSLYPTVMLLQIVLTPWLEPLGRAATVLISNATTVCILQWLVIPRVNRILGPWYQGSIRPGTGFFLILLTLLAFFVTFRQIVG